MKKKIWIQEEIQILKESIKNNERNKDIAKKLNRTYGAVNKQILNLGIQRYKVNRKKWGEEEINNLKNLSLNPLNSNETISKILNRSNPSISHKIIRAKIRKKYTLRCDVNTDKWTKPNMEWLSGYLEGEGSFVTGRYCRKNKNITSFIVQSASIDLDVLEKVKIIAGCGRIYALGGEKSKRPMWVWSIGKRLEVYALIVALFSFMGNRRKEQIRKCIEFFKTV